MKRTIRRGGCCLAGLAIASALAAAGIWLASPREPSLLATARPIMNVDEQRERWYWLSDHELLTLTSDMDRTGTQSSWRGHISLLNVRTGVRTRLDHVSRLLQRHNLWAPIEFTLSPGRTRLTLTTYVSRHGPIVTSASRLDGTGFREWAAGGWEETYYLDDRHVVEEIYNPLLVVVRDLADPKLDKRYSYPSRGASAVLNRHAQSTPYFAATGISDGFVYFDVFRSQDRLPYMHLPNGRGAFPLPVRQATLTIPANIRDLQNTDLSCDQKRAVYQGTVISPDPVLTLLHRVLPSVDVTPSIRDTIFVSGTDGSGFRILGGLPSRSRGAETGSKLAHVEWLPGSDQISFAYDGKLYLLKVGPAK